MSSKYSRSLRWCLPLWACMLQVAFILLFVFFISSDTSAMMDHKSMLTYQVLQDLTLMAALGFGFLSSFRRLSWSSIAFNLFMLALGVQGTIILDHFLHQIFQQTADIQLPMDRIQVATLSTMPVLISAGAVLGKANLVQLAVMVLMEVMAFGATRFAVRKIFEMEHQIEVTNGHVFGAYFGLLVAWSLSRCLSREVDEKAQTEKVQMATSPCLFAMLGTLFLWIFWPSFNSVLLKQSSEKINAVFNTYYALAVSTVTATATSALTHPQGKINMVHIHNAVLAGGVAVGAPCPLITSPWIAMVLGLTAGLISMGGAKCLPVCLDRMLKIQNPSGVHYTFGLPGLLGAVTYILLMATQYSYSVSSSRFVTQMIRGFGALSFALAMGMASGLLTGWLLRVKVWRAPHAAKFFDDQAFWEGGHKQKIFSSPTRVVITAE